MQFRIKKFKKIKPINLYGIADIIDNNKGSFFDALRAGGFQLLLGNEFKEAYVLGDYRLLYQKDSGDIYKTAVFNLGQHAEDNLINPDHIKLFNPDSYIRKNR